MSKSSLNTQFTRAIIDINSSNNNNNNSSNNITFTKQTGPSVLILLKTISLLHGQWECNIFTDLQQKTSCTNALCTQSNQRIIRKEMIQTDEINFTQQSKVMNSNELIRQMSCNKKLKNLQSQTIKQSFHVNVTVELSILETRMASKCRIIRKENRSWDALVWSWLRRWNSKICASKS